MFKFLIKYCKYLLSDTELGSFTILINGPIDPIPNNSKIDANIERTAILKNFLNRASSIIANYRNSLNIIL